MRDTNRANYVLHCRTMFCCLLFLVFLPGGGRGSKLTNARVPPTPHPQQKDKNN